MKSKITTLLLCIMLATTFVFAQSEVRIKTSAECETCKKKLEGNLKYEKGIKFVKLNLDDKVLSVNYNPKKTSPEEIKKAISKLGYDADDVKADSLEYSRLPECCKKDGMKHED